MVANRGVEEVLRMRCRTLSIDMVWKELTGRLFRVLVDDCEAVGVNNRRPHGITPDNTLLVRG